MRDDTNKGCEGNYEKGQKSDEENCRNCFENGAKNRAQILQDQAERKSSNWIISEFKYKFLRHKDLPLIQA